MRHSVLESLPAQDGSAGGDEGQKLLPRSPPSTIRPTVGLTVAILVDELEALHDQVDSFLELLKIVGLALPRGVCSLYGKEAQEGPMITRS